VATSQTAQWRRELAAFHIWDDDGAMPMARCPHASRRGTTSFEPCAGYAPRDAPPNSDTKSCAATRLALESQYPARVTSASFHTGGTPQLVTVAEAATLLGVSTPTIRNWIERGQVPYIRLPGSTATYRIPLHGLLSTLSGSYDLAGELDRAASADVSDEQLNVVARGSSEDCSAES
jgi:excisionase family DNA binding protein